jgi:hypothetical protein
MIAPTVPPATPRQIPVEASQQGVPIARAAKDLPPSAETRGAKSRILAGDSTAARAGQLARHDEIVAQPPARPPDKAAAQSDQTNSGARESGPFDSSARPAEAPTLGSRVAAENGGATFGTAASKYYRTTFFTPNPKLRGRVVVHHAVEQRVLRRYPGVVTQAEMHSLENLRGIPRHLNSELHLKQIRREWDQFYRENLAATRRQLLQKATEIDARYGSQFNPPIKPGR